MRGPVEAGPFFIVGDPGDCASWRRGPYGSAAEAAEQIERMECSPLLSLRVRSARQIAAERRVEARSAPARGSGVLVSDAARVQADLARYEEPAHNPESTFQPA